MSKSTDVAFPCNVRTETRVGMRTLMFKERKSWDHCRDRGSARAVPRSKEILFNHSNQGILIEIHGKIPKPGTFGPLCKATYHIVEHRGFVRTNVLNHHIKFRNRPPSNKGGNRKKHGALWHHFWISWLEIAKSGTERLCEPMSKIILSSSNIIGPAIRKDIEKS